MDSKKIENAFVEVIEALGEAQYKEELKDTPKRIADSYKEIFYGIGINPKEVLKRTFEVNSDELIIEKNIDFYSMCEHHFLPFFGTICIAYIPNKKDFWVWWYFKTYRNFIKKTSVTGKINRRDSKIYLWDIKLSGCLCSCWSKTPMYDYERSEKENTKILTTSAKGIFETDINKKLEVLTLLK